MFKLALKWGGILGIALVIVTQILTWMGLGTSNWYFALTYLLVALVAWLFIKELHIQKQGQSSFWKSIVPFAGVVIISRYIFQVYMYVYIHYLDPTWVDTIAQSWTEMMQEQNMESGDIDLAVAGFRKAYTTIPMFTSEIIKIGISQWILGIIVVGGYLFSKRK